jgi:prepilin-type N-terminal cleavage/methylation domain-containing protein
MTRRRRHRPAQAGFTMIEVMVAVLLTAIAASGLIGLYIVQSRAQGYSRHATEATVLAQDELERLRLASRTGTATGTLITETGGVGGIFTRTSIVTSGTQFVDMTVTVGWTEDNDPKTVVVFARKNL